MALPSRQQLTRPGELQPLQPGGQALLLPVTDGSGRSELLLPALVEGPAASLAITPLSASKAEGNAGGTPFTFRVSRSGNTTGVSTAVWTVASTGTAGATGADFSGGIFPTGTVSFGAGETSRTITVSVAGEATHERDETFKITLSAPSAGTTLATATANGAINNDDPLPVLRVAAASASLNEGNSGPTPYAFIVSRTGDSSIPSTVRWAVSAPGGLSNPAGTADFVGGRFPSGTVAFGPGETSKTLTVAVNGDTAMEANESFRLTLSAPTGATIAAAAATATGTIANDDTGLAIAPLSASKAEGNSGATPFTFRVTRTGVLAGVSTAAWTVSGAGSNPTNAGDFSRAEVPSGRVTFAAGVSTRTITVNVAGEAAHERDETFRVTLSAPSLGTSLVTATATGTIQNDDAARPASFAISPLDADQPEGLKGSPTPFTFLITRNGLSSGTSSVAWSANGAGSPSVGPGDFVPSRGGGSPFGALTFSANDTVKAITVNINGDFFQEDDENFVVQLFNQTGASVTTFRAFGVVRDDDLEGDSLVNTLIGSDLAEYLDGAGSADVLTGGGGPDVFGFRFSYTPTGNTPNQSTPTDPDTITDFAFGVDKIALVDFSSPNFNPFPPAPTTFSRAPDSAAATLAELTTAVFADADGATAGNQPLPARGAALVKATNPDIAGVYLLVNNATAGLSNRDDLLIKLGGSFSGALPALGSLPPGSVFL